jgi:L-ascorbate metabolism protein UlaG (beta-lactamase superfamily)
MQLIPLWAKLKFAIMPIGGNYTMDAADALHAAEFVKCSKIIGIHYNTFGYVKIDTDQAVKDFTTAGKTLLLPEVGTTIEL